MNFFCRFLQQTDSSVITAIWQNLQLDFDSLDLKRKLKQISNDCGIVASILKYLNEGRILNETIFDKRSVTIKVLQAVISTIICKLEVLFL